MLGGPASGKGTLCSRLIKDGSFVHVSPGDLVRDKQIRNDLSPEYTKLMEKGKLLPVSFIGELIMDHIKTNIPCDKTILLDGFPRNKENFDYYIKEMNGFFDLVKVIVINCSDGLMEKRTLKRQTEQHRKDDEIETFRRRLKYYHEVTEGIIKLFDEKMVHTFCPDENAPDPYPDIIKIIQTMRSSSRL